MPKKKNEKPEELAMMDRAHEATELYLDGMPYRLDTVLDRMIGGFISIQRNFIDIGMGALSIKHVHGHGEFLKIIDKTFVKTGICSDRTIRNAMSVAKFIAENPKLARRANLTELERYKQLMLAGAKEEDIDEEAGTIYGLDPEEIKAATAKELREARKKIESLKAENEKGREQLVKEREEKEYYKNRHKLLGKDEAEAVKILDTHYNVIKASLLQVFEQIDLKKMSPDLQAKVRGFAGAVYVMVEDMHEGFCIRLDKHKDPNAYTPPWKRPEASSE